MERLKRRTDFRAAAQSAANGMRAPGKAFLLQARPRGDERAARIGFTVSRQVGNAVIRNRVRRRLREIVRLSGEARLCPGHDYVLIGRRPGLTLPFGDLLRDFDAAVRRVHSASAVTATTAAGQGAEAKRTGAVTTPPLHRAGSSSPQQSRRKRRQRREERAKPQNRTSS
jgi:ribonuclease P protein component